MSGPWNWQTPTAGLTLADIAGCIDASRPSSGIHQLRLGETDLSGSLLGTLIGPSSNVLNVQSVAMRDTYVRGHDLVACYAASHDHPYRAEIYWRATTAEELGGRAASITVQVSVETDLLEAHPEIHVTTQLPASELALVRLFDESRWNVELLHAPCEKVEMGHDESVACVLYRLEEATMSYVEMTHPSDFQRLTIQSDRNRLCSRWRVFGEFLEKGVIRRALTQGLFVSREQDVQTAIQAYRAFVRAEIPLSV